jgi:D-sedoheptulose 7-phosphate isomerase
MTLFQNSLADAIAVFSSIEALAPVLMHAAEVAVETLKAGNKILACGNGGSACEAQHLVGELVGRYKHSRPALAAIALNADGATVSCIGNDFRFEEIYSRQLEALARPGDLLIAFSSSGQSPNVLEALAAARRLGVRSVSFLGGDGGPAVPLSDYAIVVSYPQTARIQEAHQFLLHSLMDQIEVALGFAI